MFSYQCPQCGRPFTTQEQVSRARCPYCGNVVDLTYAGGQQQPPQYGQQQQQQQQQNWQQQSGPQYAYGQQPQQNVDVFSNGPSGKSRGVAGLLAILLGALGVHYFYLGKTGAGVLFLILGLLSCGLLSVITLIQGILMFVMTQEDFERKYVYTNSSIPLF